MSYITELAEQAITERQQRNGLAPMSNSPDTPTNDESTSTLIQRLAQQAIKERVQAVGGNVGYKDTFYPAADTGPTITSAAALRATDKNTPLPPQATESVTMDLGKPVPNAQQQAIALESQMQWQKLNSLQTVAEKEAYLKKIEDQQRREERMVGIDRQKMQDDAIKKEIRGQQDQVLAIEKNKIGLGEQATRFQNYKNSIPFLGSVNAAVETYDLNKAIERVANGQTTLEQEKFLKSYLLDQAEIASRGRTFEAQVFDSVLQTLPYMVEWAKTAGIQAVTRSLGRKLTLKLIGPVMRVAVEKLPAKLAPIAARGAVAAVDVGKAAGTATGMTIGSPGRIAETYQQNRMPKDFTFDENGKLIIQQPGDGPLTALTRSAGYNFGQNLFELSGETAVAAIKGTAGAAGKGVAAASRKVGINPESLAAKVRSSVPGDIWQGMVKAAQIANSNVPAVQTVNKALKAAHWDGFIGENLEEFLGNYYTALTDTSPQDTGGTKNLLQRLKDATMTKEQIAVQMATLAIPGMTTAAVGTAVELHNADVLRNNRDKAKAFVLSREGAQWLWQQDPRYAASLAGVADAPSRTQVEPLQLRMNIDERRMLANNLREIGRGFLNQKLTAKLVSTQQKAPESTKDETQTEVAKVADTPPTVKENLIVETIPPKTSTVGAPASIDDYEDAPDNVYRVDTGFRHDRDTTAADVVRYEQETKGNQLGVPEHIIKQLENRSANDIVWVTAEEKDAARYGESLLDVEQMELPKGSKIIARDPDGGILVLMPKKKEIPQPPKTEPLPAHDFKEGQRVTFSDGKGGMLTGTIRSFSPRNGEPWASIDTDQIAAPGGVPIGRIENRPVRNLKKLQESAVNSDRADQGEELATDELARLVEEFDSSATMSADDLINNVEQITEDKELLDAIDNYRKSAEEDRFEYGLRGDSSEIAEQVVELIRKKAQSTVVPQPSPKPKSVDTGGYKAAEPPKPPKKSILDNLSDEKRAELEKLKTQFHDKLRNQVSSGIDPELAVIAARMGMLYIEAGAKAFNVWAKTMVDEIGDGIKPYLRGAYLNARNMPGMETHRGEMSPAAEVDALTDENIEKIIKNGIISTGDQNDGQDTGTPSKSVLGDGSGASGNRVAGQTDTPSEERQTQDVSGSGGTEHVEGGIQSDTGQSGDDERTSQRVRSKGHTAAGESEVRPGESKTTAAGRTESSTSVQRKARSGVNHVISTDDVIVPRGEITQARANIAAIKLLKQLEEENREATPEEQKILAQYTGWGNLSQLFDSGKLWAMEKERSYGRDESWEKKWGKLAVELKEILSDDDWSDAARSSLNAHYTERRIIDSMWRIAQRLGFKGGTVLEPGAGIGHFFGLMPQNVAEHSKLIGIELDSTSGRLLNKLYPKAKIFIDGFENVKLPNNSVDLVISNFPFDSVGPADAKDRYGMEMNLHNYFFARSLDALRPGGLLIAITTHFTMDAAKRQRELLASKGELIGAIRLPNNAFKENAGTEVTTDIIILRKPTSSQLKGLLWQNTAEITTDEGDQATINEYFVAHPDMMLGTPSMAGSMYARDEDRTEFTLKPKPDQNVYEAISNAVETLPLNVMGESAASTDTSEIDRIGEAKGLKEESLHLRDGQLVIVRDGKFEPAKTFYPKLGNAKAKMQAHSYIGLRDHYQNLIKLMLDETASDEAIAAARNKLNKLYDEYAFRYNLLNENPTKIFSFDPGYWLVRSLEKKINVADAKTGDIREQIVKADVFTKRTIEPRRPPLKCDTVKDALRVSLCYRGQLDVPYIAQLTGKEREQIEAQLIESGLAFENPETGLWETTETYLSGNVRKKLQEAQRAAENDEKYNRNVEKLKTIQPALIGIKDIHYKIGGTWIPADLVEEFAQQVLEVFNAEIRYVKKLDSWIVSGNSHSMANNETFGTSRLRAVDILDKILNLKRPEVYDKDLVTGKRVLNQKETTAAQMAAEKIEKEFLKWIKTSDQRVLKLQEAYNETFNWYIPPKFNGDHLELPGTSNAITLRPYQKDAVWRLLQQGYGMIAHAVGAGKTMLMAATAMEMKRLGFANKPMLVVENATLGQFATQFRTLYPTANILVCQKEDLKSDNRKTFLARMAAGDYDAIIIAQSSFNLISNDANREMRYLHDLEDDLRSELYEAKQREGKRGLTVKMIERQLKSLDKKMGKLLERINQREDTGNLSFEQLGIDALFIDEAHRYKKPPLITKIDGKVAGLATQSSQRATNLMLKCRWVQERNSGKNVFLATGTPVTNTLGEAWHMLNFVAPNALKEFGVDTFDKFISTFAVIEPTLEMNAAQKWVMRSAITKFVNGPQLLNLIRSSWDVVSTDDLKAIFKDLDIKLPKLKDDKTTIVSTPLTKAVEQFKNFLKGVYTRYEQLPGEDKRTYSWIPVVTYGAARAAALDIRLVYPNAKDDPGSKVNHAVQKAFDVWEKSKDAKGTQLIFSDTYNVVNMEKLAAFAAGGNVTLEIEEETPSEDDSESETTTETEMFLYRDIKNKLVAKGVPADEIAIVKEVKEQNREALFEQVNNGRIRILIGGTSNMGVGVNVQKRLCAIHHLDTPWVPADLEQRQGRMIRQGNTHEQVEEFAYGMENTLDAAIYTKILRKAKFIWQVLAGKVSAVEFDDPAAPLVLTAKEQQAFLSGDPRIFEKIELEHQGRQLRMEHDAHVDNIARQRVKKDGYQRDVKTFEESVIPKAQKFSDTIAASIDGANWQADIDGQSLTDPKVIAETIDTAVKPTAQRILEDAKAGKIQQWKEPSLENPPKENRVLSVTINGVNVDIYASGYAIAVTGEKGGLAKEWRQGYQTIATLADGTIVYRGTSHTGKGILEALAELPAKAQQDVTTAKARLKFFGNSIKELDELINTPWDKKQQLDEIDEKLRKLGDSLTGGGNNSAFVAKDPFMMPVEMEAKAAPVSNHAIVATISKDFGVPVYTGRVAGKPAGIYKHIHEIIRIKGKFAGDLAVTSHEVAHHIDKMYGISKMEWTEATKAELEQLDYEPMGRINEGFAEFVRHLLTEDDAHIVAPHFYHFFVDEFLSKNPELREKLLNAKNLISQWRGQGFEGRVHGYISWTGKQAAPLGVSWKDRIKEWCIEGWHKFYTAMKDQGHYLDLMVRDAARRGYKTEVGDDAYAIFKTFTQSGPTLAMTALEKGVFKLTGEMEKIGPSLHEVFEKIEEKDYERFVEWIWSRHAIEAWSKGKNPGGSLVDAHAYYQKYRSAEWEQAAQKLTDFNNSLIVMLADAGVITTKAAKAMIEYYQTYIPLMRVKNPIKRGRFGGKKLVNLPNPVHGRHGSGEQVLDPIQSTIERAIRMYERASQQIVITKAVEMAHKADGIGTWIHNVPPDFRTTGFTVGEIEDQLAKVGIDILDYEELVNQRAKEKLKKEKGDDYDENEVEEFHIDPQELLYVYRPDYYYKGSEPIAQVIVNGKPKLYQFDKDLFRAISGMNYFQLPYFMDLLMGKGTRMIRMGATGINIGFAERNVIKDAFTYLAQSNESLASTRRAIPLPAPGTMMGAYLWSETQKLLGNEADPVVELWQQMGGELSQTLGLDRNQIRKAVKDVVANSTQRRLLNVAATPLETMRQIIGVSEVSPRLSEFYAVLERHGYTRERLIEMRASGKRPPRHILVEASNAAADVTTDFKRQGWLGKWLNRVSPYWNAPLEGMDKYFRTWKSNPKRALIFSAAYAAARIAYWMMVKDEDWYKEQPKWLKYGFWTIAKDGKPWLRIPVPHLWGLVIGGGIEAILNTAEEKNPKELAKWFSQMTKDTIPDFRPSVVTQALEVWANYDLFRRQPIVDETLSRRTAEKQYTTYNTKTMIALGGILHLSPAKLEHFIDGISGGIYRRTAKPMETLVSGEPVQAADMPGLGGLALRQDYSESTQEFYDKKDQIEKQYNSAKDDGKIAPELDAQYHKFQDYADLMSQMRTAVRNVADRDKRFEVEKYIVGLARASLGKKELDRYPNPILAQDIPPVVRTACDNYLGNKLYQLTMPTPARELGETAEHYQQRRQRYEITVNRARQILDDLDIPLMTQQAILQKETRSRGLKTRALNGTHQSAYAERLSRLRKNSISLR